MFTTEDEPLAQLHLRGYLAEEYLMSDGIVVARFHDSEGSWVVATFSTRHPNVYHIFSTLPTTHKRWRKFERWMNVGRGVSRCFLDHGDFLSIGDRISEFGDVEVIKMSGRIVADNSSLNRGFPAHGLDLRPSHLDVIEEAESRGATVRTLALKVQGVLHMHLRRVAGATFYKGRFDLFEELVLSRLEDATHARRELLSGRQRNRQEPVRPITVRLTRSILNAAEDTADVMSSLHDLPDVTIAVFHRNPYLHFTVTDEFDGSNFDIMVTRPDEIDIFPGYRASMDSLARMAYRLSDRFGASEIRDAAFPQLVRVSDLTEDGSF
ncbi:hypothetical protein ACFYO7_06370 [Nocardia salmonicida]|uniref:hypothetical protein n=1 Tax=Nocardia salmonicida TaxID=53431 RepID=UPI0036C2CEFC